MKLLPFLMDLRELLASPESWHPLACANARGRVLGEFEQARPTETRAVPTEDVAVAWNLTCAIRHVMGRWEDDARLTVAGSAYVLKLAVEAELGAAMNTTQHRVALDAIDQAIGRFAVGVH